MEGNSIVANDTLDGIAQAINAKLGTSGKMTVQQMAGKVNGIEVPDGLLEFRNYEASSYDTMVFNVKYGDTLKAWAFGVGADNDLSTSNLMRIHLPSVKHIGDHACYRCGALGEVDFPKAVTVGLYAFAEVPQAATLNSDSFGSVKTLDHYAFAFWNMYNSSGSLYFPKATTLGDGVFYYACVDSISLPSAVSIGNNCFIEGVNAHISSLDLSSMTQAQVLENASYWGIPSGCTVTCSDGTITIE